ncbi:MAG: carbohydrate-binding protein [Lachnospiraceae bacterium]|nr:carbohydrate-binding protein [Lachnospiraceae bacterium]
MKITVYNDWDHVPKAEAEGTDMAVLAWNGEYRKGDVLEFAGLEPDNFYVVRVDAAIQESFVLIKRSEVTFPIPFYEKKESLNPLAFSGSRHYIMIRKAEDFEINAYRNLALNTFDRHEDFGVYPHAYANVETRGESVFEAKNATDGIIAVKSHGEWPYESWGINRQDDAKITVDFGRKVDIDEIRLYTRADFPHDNWWIAGTFTFSDGSTETVRMEKRIGEPHVFKIVRKGITSVSLDGLVKADDPSPFPALTQIEVYGTENR